MYTKQIPFKDFLGNPRNETVHFNLTETEVFKLLVEFKAIFEWRDSLKGDVRELETEQVVEFYNSFENILLEAYGVPSPDGMYFRKGGRYDFEESALFNACMVEFVTNPEETTKLVDGLMPKDMENLVRKADDSLAEAAKNSSDEQLKAELNRLRAQLAEQQNPA